MGTIDIMAKSPRRSSSTIGVLGALAALVSVWFLRRRSK